MLLRSFYRGAQLRPWQWKAPLWFRGLRQLEGCFGVVGEREPPDGDRDGPASHGHRLGHWAGSRPSCLCGGRGRRVPRADPVRLRVKYTLAGAGRAASHPVGKSQQSKLLAARGAVVNPPKVRDCPSLDHQFSVG
jgi:hypothetical protein